MVSPYLGDKYRLLTMTDQVLQDLAPASSWNSTTLPQHLRAAAAGPSSVPGTHPVSPASGSLPWQFQPPNPFSFTPHTPRHIHTTLAASEQIAPPWKSSHANHQVNEEGRKKEVCNNRKSTEITAVRRPWLLLQFCPCSPMDKPLLIWSESSPPPWCTWPMTFMCARYQNSSHFLLKSP